MIVKRVWKTTSKRDYVGDCDERVWVGWFLFGVIPLYITPIEWSLRR